MVDQARIEAAVREILEAIGEDTYREGLLDTPARVARFYAEFIDYRPGNMETTFVSAQVDQLVVVSGMRVWSLCEHHMLPFFCDIHVGYVTGERVLGLSKFARIAHACAHRLQIQERLVDEIATAVMNLANTPDVAVIGSGVHLCMLMRGIKTPGRMASSAMYGGFRENPGLRAEFLRLLDMNANSTPLG